MKITTFSHPNLGEFWQVRGNLFRKTKYTKEQALEAAKTLIWCSGCIDCEDCWHCIDCHDCTECLGCEHIMGKSYAERQKGEPILC